jgi:hypothetical protein
MSNMFFLPLDGVIINHSITLNLIKELLSVISRISRKSQCLINNHIFNSVQGDGTFAVYDDNDEEDSDSAIIFSCPLTGNTTVVRY